MDKTEKELQELKNNAEKLSKEFKVLSEEKLNQVSGGAWTVVIEQPVSEQAKEVL